MDRRHLPYAIAALALLTLCAPNARSAEHPKKLSDRERMGFRGPVKTCEKDSIVTEFAPDGRLLKTDWRIPDGSEGSERFDYDSSGRLLSVTTHQVDGAQTAEIYSYDESGKLLGVVSSKGERTTFEPDAQGRKTEIKTVSQPNSESNVGVRTDAWFEDDPDTNFRLGPGNFSLVKTIYNNRDLPVESQFYDDEGHLVSRVIRTYDSQGRIISEKQQIEDMSTMLSKEQLAQMGSQAGISEKELKARLAQTLPLWTEFGARGQGHL